MMRLCRTQEKQKRKQLAECNTLHQLAEASKRKQNAFHSVPIMYSSCLLI